MKTFRFTEAVALALHSMVLIAEDPKIRWTTQQIAEKFGVSANHLSKVHTRLVHHGMLTSVRGPKGGLVLGRAPETITLMDIYELIEGQSLSGSCLFGRTECMNGSCIFGNFLDGLNSQIRRYFQETVPSDIAGRETRFCDPFQETLTKEV